MKIHTDLLFEHHVRAAVAVLRHEGVWLEFLGEHNSRSRARRLDFRLYADPRPGRRKRRNMQHILQDPPDVVAATWNEWGIVIRELLVRDPDAVCGVYDGLDDFHDRTHDEFRMHAFDVDHPVDCLDCAPFNPSVMHAVLTENTNEKMEVVA